jgi:serine/threonine-protein kinase
MQIAFQHATESVPRPSVRNPGVPEQLDELVLWSTEKSPDERPNNAQEMLDRLREIERSLGVSPTAVAATTTPIRSQGDSGDLTKIMPSTMVIDDTAAPAAQPVDNATLLRRRTSKRRARGAFLLALVLLLAVAAGGVGWWFGSGPGSLVAVPAVAGQSYDEAAAALSGEGFVPVAAEESSVDIDPGVVIRTDPAAGERLDSGTEVSVFVSTGPAPRAVESLNGKTADEARAYLKDLGLTVSDDDLLLYSRADEGVVINASVTPRAGGDDVECGEGCSVFEADTAHLIVSLGGLPDVVGMTADEASSAMAEKDIQTSTVEEFSDDVEQGRVISVVEREDGANWRPGDTMTLVVSKGPQLFEVPDVTGQNRDDAAKTLRDAGFEPTWNPLWTPFPNGLTEVTGTDPAAGTMRRAGSEVTLLIRSAL